MATLAVALARFGRLRSIQILRDLSGLEEAATLKRIKFAGVCLQTGSWETVITGMRDVLTLDSIYMPGDFIIGGSITGGVMVADYADKKCEIDQDYAREGRKILCNRAIEDFILHKTDVNPFDLLGSARAYVPVHESQKDLMLYIKE